MLCDKRSGMGEKGRQGQGGHPAEHPPDGNLEFLLGRRQEAAEGFVGLVEAHQQYLLQAGHLRGHSGRAAPARRPARPGSARPPRTLAHASMWCCTMGTPATGNSGLGTSKESGRKRVPAVHSGSAGPGAGRPPRGARPLTLLRAPDEDHGLQRHDGTAAPAWRDTSGTHQRAPPAPSRHRRHRPAPRRRAHRPPGGAVALLEQPRTRLGRGRAHARGAVAVRGVSEAWWCGLGERAVCVHGPPRAAAPPSLQSTPKLSPLQALPQAVATP